MDSSVRKITRIETDYVAQNLIIDEACRRGHHPALGSGGVTTLNTGEFIKRMSEALQKDVPRIKNLVENYEESYSFRKEIGVPTIRKVITEAKKIAEEADTQEIEFINNR